MNNLKFARKLGWFVWRLLWMTGLAMFAYRLLVGGGPFHFPGLL